MTDQEQKQFNEIHTASIIIRGTILGECIGLEKTIDDFIAKDISLDEQIQLRIFTKILDRLTFEAKITAFTAILDEAQDEAGFIKTKNNSYPHKELIKKLRTIKDERNYFAHQTAWLQPEALRYYPKVAFVNFRDKTKIELYDNDRVEKIVDLIRETGKEIINMITGMDPA